MGPADPKTKNSISNFCLKGIEGDRINAILSPAGINFRKRLNWAADFYAIFSFGFIFFKEKSGVRASAKY